MATSPQGDQVALPNWFPVLRGSKKSLRPERRRCVFGPGSGQSSSREAEFTNPLLPILRCTRRSSGPLSGAVKQRRLRHVADEHVASPELGFDEIIGQ